jgi:hypothetical protein
MNMKWIGIVCLAFSMTYYHPCEKPMDWVFVVLFWIGLTCYVNGSEE